MRFWTILLSTVFVCSAALVGVMWRGRPAEPTPTVSEGGAIEPQNASAPIRSYPRATQLSPGVPGTANLDPRAAQLSSAVPDAATDPHAARLPPAGPDSADVVAAPAPAAGSSTPAKAALPVQIRFHHINTIIEATVVNVSKEDLTVDVSVLQSGSQTTLDLAPGIPTIFGAREGLELHPADEVTLRGGAYRELVTTVR